MVTPATAPAGARPVAVAAVAIQAVKTGVDVAKEDPARKAELKAMMTTLYRVANGADGGRASGPAAGPDQAELRDVSYDGPDGATVAWRQRIGTNGRPVRELVGLGENDTAAGRQAAEALGRTAGAPVPGLEVYGARPTAAVTVDDRTAVLDTREAVATTQNGLSTGSPTQQRPTGGGLGTKAQTGSRVQQAQQNPDRAR